MAVYLLAVSLARHREIRPFRPILPSSDNTRDAQRLPAHSPVIVEGEHSSHPWVVRSAQRLTERT
jgi:hypothetical protein